MRTALTQPQTARKKVTFFSSSLNDLNGVWEASETTSSSSCAVRKWQRVSAMTSSRRYTSISIPVSPGKKHNLSRCYRSLMIKNAPISKMHTGDLKVIKISNSVLFPSGNRSELLSVPERCRRQVFLIKWRQRTSQWHQMRLLPFH